MKLSICVSTNPAKFEAVPLKGDFISNVLSAKEVGFDGVELAIRDPRTIDQELILSTIHDASMEIPAIGTGQAWGEEGLSFTDPDPNIRKLAVQRVTFHLDFAKKAKAMVIIGLLRGKLKPGVDQNSAWEWMYDSFCRCCEEAEKTGVKIAMEPINRYETTLLNTAADSLVFIDRVGSPNLGMLLDTFHMNIEEASIENSIRYSGDKIFHFHYADSNRRYPGAGHLDFPSIVASLSSIGYSGYLSGEHLALPDPISAIRNGCHYMRNAISRQE